MSQVQWSSRLGHVLAAAGSAIGLGAIWKFPYVTATNGGGAFLLVFLLFSFTLGVAVQVGETLLGSHSQRGVLGAFRKLVGPNWRWMGYMGDPVRLLHLQLLQRGGGLDRGIRGPGHRWRAQPG